MTLIDTRKIGRKGGKARSRGKTKAARRNGAKGGRPSVVSGPYIYCPITHPDALTVGQIDRSEATEAGYISPSIWLAALALDGQGLRPMTRTERATK